MQRTSAILKKRFQQYGLGEIMDATNLCAQAEKISPDLFQAVSVRESKTGENILHLKLSKANLIKFKLQQGHLLSELNLYAKSQNLRPIDRLRLTYLENSAKI